MAAHIVITLTVIGFIFLGLVLFWKLKPELPKGARVTIQTPYCKVHTIIDPNCKGGSELTASLSSMAVRNAIQAWKLKPVLPLLQFDQICVLIKDSKCMAEFANKWGYKHLSGFASNISGILGKSIPCITINEDQDKASVNYGFLVIHEMLHVLSNDYAGGAQDHSDPAIWQEAAKLAKAKESSVQEKADNNFLVDLGMLAKLS
jgi:hypothetical protein